MPKSLIKALMMHSAVAQHQLPLMSEASSLMPCRIEFYFARLSSINTMVRRKAYFAGSIPLA